MNDVEFLPLAKTKLLCVYYSRLTPRMQMRIIFLSGAQRRDPPYLLFIIYYFLFLILQKDRLWF